MSYLVPNEEDTTKYTLYINSDGKVVANENSSYLFGYFTNLQEIEHLEYLDTGKVTDMNNMFYGCKSLTTLDISNFDTSNITDMSRMFYNCSSLTFLDISNSDVNDNQKIMHLFYSMPDNAIVKVKDKTVQYLLLYTAREDGLEAWTTENVIIKEA